jgi:hypothetical protein
MEQKRSPVQLYYLFKSFVMMFMIQALIVLFTPLQITAPIWYQILAVNLIVAGVLGWFLYKQRYHIELSYDDDGFQLKKGKGPSTSHKWNEFSQVSLARNEYGEFIVRMHRNGDRLEIPVSKLKLDPFQFRLQVMNYVAKAASPPR